MLKKILNVRKISARWVPHLLTDDQMEQRVKIAKQLLKYFQSNTKRNVVTRNLVHYFELFGMLAIKHGPLKTAKDK